MRANKYLDKTELKLLALTIIKRNTVNTVNRFSNKMSKNQHFSSNSMSNGNINCNKNNSNGNGNGNSKSNSIGICNSNSQRNSIISEEFYLFPFKCGMSMGTGLEFWGKGR